MITTAPNVETTEETTAREAFHITDERAASWLLRKLANLESEKARIKAQAGQMMAQIERDAARLSHLYGAELEAWAREEIARKGNRRKSLTLFQGTLAFRTVPAAPRIADLAAALAPVVSDTTVRPA